MLLKGARNMQAVTDVPQAVVLSAPTGAGKTVIATAVIEAFLAGSDEQPADPSAVFLWVTDQPALNKQTARKMLESSSRLTESDLVDVTSDFDAEKFEPGTVYFINTQKLMSGARLLRRDDDRHFTFWDTFRNSIDDPTINLFVVIDEAHRGTSVTDEEEALPIMQRFLFGQEAEDDSFPPAPVTLGISATPENFDKLLAGGAHGRQPVEVPASEVILSGLIKKRIHIVLPDADTTDPMALLRTATEKWVESCDAWQEYHDDYGGPVIEPILVVQIENAPEDKFSNTDVAAAIKAIREVGGDLVKPDEAFAHATGTEKEEPVPGMSLRYLAPDDIDRDPDVRVVFFKTSLNQGWDCPRAEVMTSFRTHEDDTLIAQLIGRMVRAPLARRIEERDELNSVELFLPYFDERTVEKVRDKLEGVVPSDTETGTKPPVTLVRAPKSGAFFKALEGLPTYVVPRVRKTKQTRRAVALAGLLDQHGVTTDCSDETVSRLVEELLKAQTTRMADPAFQAAIAGGGVIPVIVRAYDPYGGTIGEEDERMEIEASPSHAEDLWRYAGRIFGASLHKPYVRARVEADGKSVVTTAKYEAAALASDSGVIDALEATARVIVDELLDAHGAAIDALDAAAAADFERVREQADAPVMKKLKLPRTIEVRPSDKKAPDGHVYVEKGTSGASFAFGTWERAAVNEGV